jgi:hypothetical protein
LRGVALRIFNAILEYRRGDTNEIKLSDWQIAQSLGYKSKSTVRKKMPELEAKGYLRRERRPEGRFIIILFALKGPGGSAESSQGAPNQRAFGAPNQRAFGAPNQRAILKTSSSDSSDFSEAAEQVGPLTTTTRTTPPDAAPPPPPIAVIPPAPPPPPRPDLEPIGADGLPAALAALLDEVTGRRARFDTLPRGRRDQIADWWRHGDDPIFRAETLAAVDAPPPPAIPPPTASVAELVAALPGHPLAASLAPRAARALVQSFADSEGSWTYWEKHCREIAAGVRPAESLTQPLERVLGELARGFVPETTPGKYLYGAVRNWEQEHPDPDPDARARERPPGSRPRSPGGRRKRLPA